MFTYICDFVYLRNEMANNHPDTVLRIWRTVYEDAKGYRKGSAYQLFRLKKAVILAAMGIEIDEV